MKVIFKVWSRSRLFLIPFHQTLSGLLHAWILDQIFFSYYILEKFFKFPIKLSTTYCCCSSLFFFFWFRNFWGRKQIIFMTLMFGVKIVWWKFDIEFEIKLNPWLIKMWTHLQPLIIFYINLKSRKNMQLPGQNDENVLNRFVTFHHNSIWK